MTHDAFRFATDSDQRKQTIELKNVLGLLHLLLLHFCFCLSLWREIPHPPLVPALSPFLFLMPPLCPLLSRSLFNSGVFVSSGFKQASRANTHIISIVCVCYVLCASWSAGTLRVWGIELETHPTPLSLCSCFVTLILIFN